MILPNVRASFGRAEAGAVLRLLADGDAGARSREEERLGEEGFDALLDDPRTLNALLTERDGGAPAPLVFYVLIRHALLECGLESRTLADYVAAMVMRFGHVDGTRPGDENAAPYRYLVDIVTALDESRGQKAFLLKAHLGDYALWLSGLYPDRVEARVERRGAPGLGYYESLGSSGYRMAADAPEAGRYHIDGVLRACAEAFPVLRVALNHVSDRYLFPQRGDPVNRLLRQVRDDARLRGALD